MTGVSGGVGGPHETPRSSQVQGTDEKELAQTLSDASKMQIPSNVTFNQLDGYIKKNCKDHKLGDRITDLIHQMIEKTMLVMSFTSMKQASQHAEEAAKKMREGGG